MSWRKPIAALHALASVWKKFYVLSRSNGVPGVRAMLRDQTVNPKNLIRFVPAEGLDVHIAPIPVF
jgi:thiamine transport system substrate-binding protein